MLESLVWELSPFLLSRTYLPYPGDGLPALPTGTSGPAAYREYDVWKLMQLRKPPGGGDPLDVFLSHDWPQASASTTNPSSPFHLCSSLP